ncbi:MAG TPA: hypothetical protein VND45_12035 [Thermoanaerobaculia bacterium]|jgi:hypothetical protein|nr:hypothetical protein [Thermoanaerobaculia bacterium]
MPRLTVDLDVFRAALFDHSLSQVGESLLEAKLTSPLRIESLAFSPKLGVRVLNRADDKDADAVFGTSDSAHIPYAAQSAWLKYTLTAKADVKLPILALRTGASGELALSDYRRHAATDSAWSALTTDLTKARTLLDLDDVKSLQPGEALSLELGGTIAATVSFSWSDLLATKLIDVVGELPIAVKLNAGLTASASVKLTDQFTVVASRTADGHYRFAVKKAASRRHDFGLDVSVGADAKAQDVAAELLQQLPAGVPRELADKLVEKLEEAARWKASAGFAYEYARIDENSAIADFILLDESKLAADHALVLGGDFAKLTDALNRDAQSHELVRYLNESTLTSRSSFGFTLGIGKWALSSRETSTFRMTTRRSLDGFQLITAQGTRKYDEKNVPQNDFEWIVDLKAQMTEFALTPTTRDFDYGLHLLATIDRGAIAEGDVERMVDFAEMWGARVPSPSAFAEAVGTKGTLRVQMLLEREALAAAFGGDADWAEPLAMAMPYASTFPERRTYGARRDAYAAAWSAWLREERPAPLRLHSGLAIVEQQGAPGSFVWTSGEGHPHLRQSLDAFSRGAKLLSSLMTSAQPPETIGDAYALLSELWSQRLYVAALGRWLVERGAARATMQVAFGDTTLMV